MNVLGVLLKVLHDTGCINFEQSIYAPFIGIDTTHSAFADQSHQQNIRLWRA